MSLNSVDALKSALWYSNGTRFEDDVTRVEVCTDPSRAANVGGPNANQDLIVSFAYKAGSAADAFRVGFQVGEAWSGDAAFVDISRDLSGTIASANANGKLAYSKTDEEGVGIFTLRFADLDTITTTVELCVDLQGKAPVTLYDLQLTFAGSDALTA